ncbi:MAG TPA: hypothetical protein VEQ60_25965 [Longimicrobium sp.]|nr:hypothetical protein [Longimicrobium sp.]
MRKIRLDVEALAVDSFFPAGGEGKRAGTVQGHQIAVPTTDTGIHGCYACPHTVLETCLTCPRTTNVCPQTRVCG